MYFNIYFGKYGYIIHLESEVLVLDEFKPNLWK